MSHHTSWIGSHPRSDLSRRHFLGSVALAAGGVVTRSPAGENPPRVVVGIMGLKRGLSLAETFATTPGVEIRYLCDADTDRQAKAAARMKDLGVSARVTGEFRRLLDDPELDALVCAAPNHWHGPATILACAAGKHVYVEKPCSHTPQEGEWMIAAARKHRRVVQVGTQRRSSGSVREAVGRLHGGVIGDLHAARSWYFNRRRSIGTGVVEDPPTELDFDAWQGPAPRRPYRSNLIHYNWHWFWDYGNGELGNNGVHAIDICRWGLNVEHPARVVSSGGRYWFADDQQTPDTQTVVMEFNDRAIFWTGQSCNSMGKGFVCFYGSEGSLAVDTLGGYQIFDPKGKLIEETPGTPGRGQEEHVANFVQAVRDANPGDLNADVAIGHGSTLLCHLGNISQRIGRPVRCDPADGGLLDDPAAAELWGRHYEPGWEPVI